MTALHVNLGSGLVLAGNSTILTHVKLQDHFYLHLNILSIRGSKYESFHMRSHIFTLSSVTIAKAKHKFYVGFFFCTYWESSVVNHLKQRQGILTKTFISSQFNWRLVWHEKVNTKHPVGEGLALDQKQLWISESD